MPPPTHRSTAKFEDKLYNQGEGFLWITRHDDQNKLVFSGKTTYRWSKDLASDLPEGLDLSKNFLTKLTFKQWHTEAVFTQGNRTFDCIILSPLKLVEGSEDKSLVVARGRDAASTETGGYSWGTIIGVTALALAVLAAAGSLSFSVQKA
jgi:hypothetical protein